MTSANLNESWYYYKAYFLNLYMSSYLRTKFQAFSLIQMVFRQGGQPD